MESLHILGVRVDALTYEMLLQSIERFIGEGTPRQVVTVNPEFVMKAQGDADFRRIINESALSMPDGVGLLWAARLLGKRLPERVTGSDSIWMLAELSARRGYGIYFLGAAPGVAEKAAGILKGRYPGMVVSGTYAGSPSPAEDEEIAAMVKEASPQILLVAYGAPKQDRWIARNINAGRIGVPVCIGVGGTFDFVAGVAPRAPVWMRRCGLEWLHRLVTQPWRWRRMLSLPRFAWKVMVSRYRGEI